MEIKKIREREKVKTERGEKKEKEQALTVMKNSQFRPCFILCTTVTSYLLMAVDDAKKAVQISLRLKVNM